MGNWFVRSDYSQVGSEDIDNIELKPRKWDCVIVFHVGEEEDWKPDSDGSKLTYDYLKLLDPQDIEKRKKKFPQHGADFGERITQKEFYSFEMKLVLKALKALNISWQEIKEMKSEDRGNKRFFFIGLNEAVCRKYADKIGYELELEPTNAIMYLNLLDESLAKATLSDEEDAKNIQESIWDNMYVKYNDSVAPEIFKDFEILNQEDEKPFGSSLFRIRDRLSLINSIVTSDVEVGGTGINIPVLKEKDHCVCDFFPLHTQEQLDVILYKLFSFNPYYWLNLPLREFREYFGEYIAIYFAFLEFYTKYLLPAAIIGLLFGLYQLIEENILVTGVAYFGLFIIIWAILFPILWKRQEYDWALRWGTLRFDFVERSRPQFNGMYIRSDIDGQIFEYFPDNLRNQRRIFTFSIVICCFIALGVSITAVILLRIYVADHDSFEYGDYYVSIANALVIMIFNNIYGIFAEKLNEWENYKTDTEYENNLILKVFAFRFINSYAALYYIAFVRRFETDSNLNCTAEGCMENLTTQVAIIFLTQLFVSNAVELGELIAAKCAKGGVSLSAEQDIGDRIWGEYNSALYERTFDDYCELVITFGYCALFVIAFPVAPFAGFLSGIVEARIDGYKLCKLTRRPFPRQADDIGMWQLALEVMGWAVLLTNLAIICFVSDELDIPFGVGDTWFEEALTYLFLFFLLAIIVSILTCFIKAKPRSVDAHIQRMNHIEREVARFGSDINNYLENLGEAELNNWKTWPVQHVVDFLREILLKNPNEYRPIEQIFQHNKIDGHAFSTLTERKLGDMGIGDITKRKFILNCRKILLRQLVKMKKQEEMFDDIERVLTSREENPSLLDSLSGRNRTQTTESPYFEFTKEHLLPMAEFFEDDLAGQSKKKLWARVDKDESSIIEKNELGTFLYYSILVYIKAKHANARLPKKDDPKFLKKVIDPLKKWLLHYKITPHGLTYDEFDRYFPQWIRDFVKEFNDDTKSNFINRLPTFGIHSDSKDNKDNKDNKEEEKKDSFLSRMGQSDSKPRAQSSSGSSEFSDETSSKGGASNNNYKNLPKEEWPIESIDWEKKLDDIAAIVEKTDSAIRKNIWDRFDKQKKGSLTTDKPLMRLLYALIALYVRSKDKTAKPPKLHALLPLLDSIVREMRPMLPGTSSTITKHDFVNNISNYLRKIAQQRRAQDAENLQKEVSILGVLSSNKNPKKTGK